MTDPADFQKICDTICDRLTRDESDVEAFEMLHSPEFTVPCAWMGVDPDDAGRRIKHIAACRRNN